VNTVTGCNRQVWSLIRDVMNFCGHAHSGVATQFADSRNVSRSIDPLPICRWLGAAIAGNLSFLSSIEYAMPTEAITAMKMARSNFGYISEALDEAQLFSLKNSSTSFNQALQIAGLISHGELTSLTEELESACVAWQSLHK
jgi:hypothetical protein